MEIETKCVQEGYKPKNGEARTLPIYQSTTYKYDSGEHLAKLFDLAEAGHMYSRISNPTLAFVEEKIASLEGGVCAMLTSTGQSAILNAILNICQSGEHIISSSSIYGGATNLFAVTMKKMGIDFTFINQDDDEESLQKAFTPKTKAVFAETIANPGLNVADIEKLAKIAHKNEVPLIIDNTFATPILCRPFEYGADIIIHSTSKYMDGHATVLGGVIVDSGKFDWSNGKFPELVEPDSSYHGISYVKSFKEKAYITKARVQILRDLGNSMSPLSAFILNYGLESLHLRMERHSENALKVANFLESRPSVSWVSYPGLKSNKYHALSEKYLTKGCSGVISFGIKGGREKAVAFMDNLKLANIVVHVADTRTCVLHPASTTHRQLTDEQLKNTGITPELIRLSVGIENVNDIIEDLEQAFSCLK